MLASTPALQIALEANLRLPTACRVPGEGATRHPSGLDELPSVSTFEELDIRTHFRQNTSEDPTFPRAEHSEICLLKLGLNLEL